MTASLVSLVGPPAAGKTTLAVRLAHALGAHLVREDFEGNPFLVDSYTGPHEARLPAQLFYLLSRVQQLSSRTWPADGTVVTDYGFCHDRIFAEVRLSEDEFAVYSPVADALEALVQPADVLVCLDADEDVLLERIRRRGRGFEHVMTRDFLGAIRDGCARAAYASACPVLSVDAGKVDFRRDEALADIAAQVRDLLPAGET